MQLWAELLKKMSEQLGVQLSLESYTPWSSEKFADDTRPIFALANKTDAFSRSLSEWLRGYPRVQAEETKWVYDVAHNHPPKNENV